MSEGYIIDLFLYVLAYSRAVKLRDALAISASLFSRREKAKLLFFGFSQTIIGVLDLIGVSAFSAACVLLIRGDAGSEMLTRYLGWIPWIPENQLALSLSILAPVALLSKTTLSFYFNRQILRDLSRLQENLSSALYSEALSWPPRKLQQKSRQDLELTIVDGVSGLCIGVIGYSIFAFSEFFLLLILFLPVIFITPPITLAILFLVLLMFSFLFKIIGNLAQSSGREYQESFFDAKDFVRNTGELSKEIWARGNSLAFIGDFRRKVSRAAQANARDFHIQQMPKFAMEFVFLILGVILIIGFVGVSSIDLGKSVGLVSFLMVTGFRILPSYLRLQGSLIVVRTCIGQSKSFLESILSKEFSGKNFVPDTKLSSIYPPEINLKSVSYSYHGSEKKTIADFSMTIAAGEKIVVRGPSGIGKSTLVDLILGFIKPDLGSIEFVNADKDFAASYMSQSTTLIRGTLTANIALGINPPDEYEVARLFKELQLDRVFNSNKGPNEIELDHRGSGISGGELQRIGLARALYGSPSLIVLDEPTSSLDADSQQIISEALMKLKNVTLIIIAHSSWPEEICDRIISFNESGEISVTAGKHLNRNLG
jgi:ABC-type transport system involved in cytochrome bd biosynthesis fused ATPase/permease subunit